MFVVEAQPVPVDFDVEGPRTDPGRDATDVVIALAVVIVIIIVCASVDARRCGAADCTSRSIHRFQRNGSFFIF